MPLGSINEVRVNLSTNST